MSIDQVFSGWLSWVVLTIKCTFAVSFYKLAKKVKVT